MLKKPVMAACTCLVLLLSACSGKKDPYRGMQFRLPDAADYKNVIAAVLKNDTTLAPAGTVVSADLPALKFESPGVTKEKKDTGTVIIRPGFGSFVQKLRSYGMLSGSRPEADSLYFLFQNDSAKDLRVDSTVIKAQLLPLKQIEGENFKRPSLILMLPVFNADKTKVLISTDKPGDKSCDYVLEKAGNEWRMLSKNRNE